MTFLVGPNSRGVIFNLCKLFPSMDWDDLDTTFNYVVMGKTKPNEYKAYLSIMVSLYLISLEPRSIAV